MISRKWLAQALAVVAVLMGPAPGGADQVLVYSGPERPLSERIAWAEKEAGARGFGPPYWMGYGIRRLMGERSFIGWSFIGWQRGPGQRPTLDDLISGRKTPLEKRIAADQAVRGTAALELDGRKPAAALWPGEKPERRVWKDLGILLFIPEAKSAFPKDFRVSNLSASFDFDGFPLIWLGMAEDAESLAYLFPLYEKAPNEEDRLSVLRAVSLHRNAPLVVPFIERLLSSKQPEAIRAEAAECLGEQDDQRALEILLKTIRNDPSSEVREQAVWGVSEMELPAAAGALGSLALGGPDREVRSHAVRGLADKATAETVKILEKIASGDKDPEVQAEAIRAFADLPGKGGLPYLVNLARTHADPGVRKEAIGAIGEVGGREAVKILTEIVRQKVR
jgi:HEAT repeat protein